MTYRDELKKAIEALLPLEGRDPLYSDCLFHLQSHLRAALKRRPEDKDKLPPGDFLNHPSDGWDNDKEK